MAEVFKEKVKQAPVKKGMDVNEIILHVELLSFVWLLNKMIITWNNTVL